MNSKNYIWAWIFGVTPVVLAIIYAISVYGT